MHEAADIAVRWPLRLRGNGCAPEDTVLVCPRGADAALVFRCGGLHGTLSASQLSWAPKGHCCGQEYPSGVPAERHRFCRSCTGFTGVFGNKGPLCAIACTPLTWHICYCCTIA